MRNTDKPAWDKSHRIEFVETLRIGGDEDDSDVFGQLVSIAADTRGRLIVADYHQNSVRRYDENGELLGMIGLGGDGPGEYRNVWSIATDSKDHIYVAGQGRVSAFDAEGKYVSEFLDESHANAWSVRVLADGSILLAEFDSPTHTTLQKYVNGKHVAHFSEAHKFPDDVALALMGSLGGSADIGPDGAIYYAQIVPYEIRKFTPAGDLVMRVFRENDFVKPPRVEKVGDGVTISGGCGSYAIFVLPDGRFINVVLGVDDGNKPFSIFDLFDADGHFLHTQRLEKTTRPLWLDSHGNTYAFDRDAGAVVRYRMTIH